MKQETRQEVVSCACRWANNIIVEVLSSHGSALPDKARDAIRDAKAALEIAQRAIRFPTEGKP